MFFNMKEVVPLVKKEELPSVGTISTRECSDEVSELGLNDYCCNLGNDDDSNGDVYRNFLVAQAKYESARAELNDLKLRNDKDNEMMNLLKEREKKLAKLKQQLDEQLESRKSTSWRFSLARRRARRRFSMARRRKRQRLLKSRMRKRQR